MVTLTNKSGRMRVYNLDHPFFRTKKWGARRMNVTVIEEAKDGHRRPRILKRSMPGSLTLLAGESREGLPDQICAVAAIKKDIKAKRLVATKVKKDAAKAKPVEKPAPKKAAQAAPKKRGEG